MVHLELVSIYICIRKRKEEKKRLKTEAEQTNNFNPFDAFYRIYYVKIFIHYELKLKVKQKKKVFFFFLYF
jgi:hypothetical protein